MNPAAPPVLSGAHAEDGGTGGRTNVGVAVKSGLVACVATFAVAQIPPLLIELSGGGLSFSTARKLGWFYGLAFHRVGIDLSGAGGFEGARVRRVPLRDGVRRVAALPRRSHGRRDRGHVGSARA